MFPIEIRQRVAWTHSLAPPDPKASLTPGVAFGGRIGSDWGKGLGKGEKGFGCGLRAVTPR